MPRNVPVPQDPEALRTAAKTLREEALHLEALATAMADDGFPVLQCFNYDQFRRSLQYVPNFAGAVRAAYLAAKEERGDYKAKGANASGESAPKKKARSVSG